MEYIEIYKKNLKFRCRKINKKYYILDGHKCYEINEMGNFIWNKINSERSIEDICNLLKLEYDISVDRIANDIFDFFHFMKDKEIIKLSM